MITKESYCVFDVITIRLNEFDFSIHIEYWISFHRNVNELGSLQLALVAIGFQGYLARLSCLIGIQG